ncbi:MAG: leucine-rich repeat protein, partial [Anaeroplasmataceae bacterium]|nr:leucine-rich repeat protein [Anaeroplasmataceae bacterium]
SYTIHIKYYFKNELIETKSAKSGYEYVIDYIPNITGYTFNYWKNEKGAKVTTITPFSNESFFADATANKITFTLNVNGGDELTTTKQEVTYDQTYQLPVPTRTGYTFLGWYNGETAVTDDKGKGLSVCNIDKNTTLKAQWEVNTYTLSLQGDAVKGTITGDGTYKYDSKVTLKATPNPGYTFDGWYNSEDELLSSNATYTYTMGLTTTITAKFDYEIITLNYIVNGEPYKTETYTLNQHITNLTNYAVEEGEVFLGWFSKEDFFSVTSAFLTTIETSTRNLTIENHNTYLYGGTYVGTEGLNFGYYKQGDFYSITKYNNTTATNVVIPAMFNNKKVIKIDSSVFEGSNLISITIPDSVTSIGNNAFYECYRLVEIYNLSSLNITKRSENYGYIGYYAKSIHTSLEEKSNLIEKDNYVYIKDDENKYYLVGYKEPETQVTLPNDIEGHSYDIYNSVFYGCSNLTSIIIPDSVTSIGKNAFSNCQYLTSVTIGKSVTSIGDGAFSNCIRLASITIPDSVTSIGNEAFYKCGNLTNITIPHSVTSIGKDAFESCGLKWNIINNGYYLGNNENPYFWLIKIFPRTITTFTINSNTRVICDSVFYGCSNLTSITIPDSVTSIGNYAFFNCQFLTSVTIGKGVTSIGNHAFHNCIRLTRITIPSSVTTIGDYAFYGCSNLGSLSLSKGVTTIGDYAFYGCSNLGSIRKIPNSVTSIGNYAFCNSDQNDIVIPNSVKYIGTSPFGSVGVFANIYYEGISSEWKTVSKDSSFYYNVYYYSETEITTSSRYWHYVDGFPTKWLI